MGSPSRNVQYHPPRLSEDRLNLPQPHSPSLPTHCTAPGNRECARSAQVAIRLRSRSRCCVFPKQEACYASEHKKDDSRQPRAVRRVRRRVIESFACVIRPLWEINNANSQEVRHRNRLRRLLGKTPELERLPLAPPEFTKDSDRYRIANFIEGRACSSSRRETHREPARWRPSPTWSPSRR